MIILILLMKITCKRVIEWMILQRRSLSLIFMGGFCDENLFNFGSFSAVFFAGIFMSIKRFLILIFNLAFYHTIKVLQPHQVH